MPRLWNYQMRGWDYLYEGGKFAVTLGAGLILGYMLTHPLTPHPRGTHWTYCLQWDR